VTDTFLSSEERIEQEALQVAARNPATLVARSFITYRNECYVLRGQRDALLAACKAALADLCECPDCDGTGEVERGPLSPHGLPMVSIRERCARCDGTGRTRPRNRTLAAQIGVAIAKAEAQS